MRRPAIKELIRMALKDAIEWQRACAESENANTPEYRAHRDRAEQYKFVLDKRYGSAPAPKK